MMIMETARVVPRNEINVRKGPINVCVVADVVVVVARVSGDDNRSIVDCARSHGYETRKKSAWITRIYKKKNKTHTQKCGKTRGPVNHINGASM